jgi:hypothetical protein
MLNLRIFVRSVSNLPLEMILFYIPLKVGENIEWKFAMCVELCYSNEKFLHVQSSSSYMHEFSESKSALQICVAFALEQIFAAWALAQ